MPTAHATKSVGRDADGLLQTRRKTTWCPSASNHDAPRFRNSTWLHFGCPDRLPQQHITFTDCSTISAPYSIVFHSAALPAAAPIELCCSDQAGGVPAVGNPVRLPLLLAEYTLSTAARAGKGAPTWQVCLWHNVASSACRTCWWYTQLIAMCNLRSPMLGAKPLKQHDHEVILHAPRRASFSKKTLKPGLHQHIAFLQYTGCQRVLAGMGGLSGGAWQGAL